MNDTERLRYGLEVVVETADNRQVAPFTENLVASLAVSVASGCATIELTRPVTADLAGVAE